MKKRVLSTWLIGCFVVMLTACVPQSIQLKGTWEFVGYKAERVESIIEVDSTICFDGDGNGFFYRTGDSSTSKSFTYLLSTDHKLAIIIDGNSSVVEYSIDPKTKRLSLDGLEYRLISSEMGKVVEQTNSSSMPTPMSTPTPEPTEEPTPEATPTPTPTPMSTPTPTPTEERAPTIPLSEDPNALREPTAEMIAGAAEGKLIKSGVRMRQGPSTDTTIIATGLKSGTKVTVYAEDGDFYFLLVNETKKYGYISKKFVKLLSALGETSTGNDQPKGTVRGTISSSNLALREGPGVTYQSLGQYYEGKLVYIFYQEGDYYYVQVAGTELKGYMSAQFIKAEGEVSVKGS